MFRSIQKLTLATMSPPPTVSVSTEGRRGQSETRSKELPGNMESNMESLKNNNIKNNFLKLDK